MEETQSTQFFTLQQVLKSIQTTLQNRYKSSFWVKAEINKLNFYTHSGHCYPELVEKKDGKVIAQMRAVLWKNDFERINSNFLKTIREPLREGIQVLFQASIQFDPMYGLSLKISEVDLSFSLGELERERQATIAKLKEEGLLDANKRRNLPLLPKRLAIISVETSKGLADFNKVILENPYGYAFTTYLFPALLQGDKSVPSIIRQLKRIKKVLHHFDAVAIIRGGGGDVGLSSFNHYDLCKAIASFPIPVLTGIGHSTNETVAEQVSYRNAITPTELADFLVQQFHQVAVVVEKAEQRIPELATQLIVSQHQLVSSLANRLVSQVGLMLEKNKNELQVLRYKISHHSKNSIIAYRTKLNESLLFLKQSNFKLQQHQLPLKEMELKLKFQLGSIISEKQSFLDMQLQKLHLLDPQRVLERGYSITLKNGKPLSDSGKVKSGDVITTILEKGKIESEVK